MYYVYLGNFLTVFLRCSMAYCGTVTDDKKIISIYSSADIRTNSGWHSVKRMEMGSSVYYVRNHSIVCIYYINSTCFNYFRKIQKRFMGHTQMINFFKYKHKQFKHGICGYFILYITNLNSCENIIIIQLILF